MDASRETSSIWTENVETLDLAELDRDVRVDAAIVGAGITGLTAAALLKRAGRTVAVIEAGEFGKHGTTHRTSAHLTAMLDRNYADLIRVFGFDAVRDAVQASQASIDTIETLARELGFDNEFRRADGYQYTEFAEEIGEIDEEFECSRRLGLRVELVDHLPLGFFIERGYRVADQAQFHPLKHLIGLAKYVHGGGSYVFHKSPVREYDDGEPCTVTTDRATVRADHIILATHSPIGVWATIQTRLVPLRSYCIAAKLRGEAPAGLYWDNADPYHYTRRYEPDGGRTLIIGGADTKTGHEKDTRQSFETLERYARARFDIERIEHYWSAQFFEPADGFPYIGLGPGMKHTYIGTGYSGTGLTYGTVAAMLITDMIQGFDPRWAHAFRPSRVKPLASAKGFMKEAAATVKGLVIDRVFKIRDRDASAIKPGEGSVIKHNGEQVAVCRGKDGSLKAVSAVCTHMGCIVQWNNAEQHWDCPCHGSIFSPDGEVMSGPAERALKVRQIETEPVAAGKPKPGRREEPERSEAAAEQRARDQEKATGKRPGLRAKQFETLDEDSKLDEKR